MAWNEHAQRLKVEVLALYLAYRDPRVPWFAKAFAACVVAYALSPIDLIPDFIPVVGHLDDLVLIPLGLLVARRMIPPEVLADCRQRAQDMVQRGTPVNRIAAATIVAIWLVLGAATIWAISRRLSPTD